LIKDRENTGLKISIEKIIGFNIMIT